MNGQDPKPEIFDVFLCHNSDDKPAVREIAQELIKEGIKPWLDEREIPLGTSWQTAIGEQIESIKSAAVFVGQRNKGRVYTKHKCSSRKRDSFALQNIYFRSHGARNSGGFPRNMVSCFKSRKREASDLPLDASLRKFIVPEQLTRFAALGGHENRGVAAHEITAQLARCRVEALEQYHWNSYAFFAGTRAAPAWLCAESILA